MQINWYDLGFITTYLIILSLFLWGYYKAVQKWADIEIKEIEEDVSHKDDIE